MRRVVLVVVLLLGTVGSGVTGARARASTGTAASLDVGWQLVLAAQQVRGRSDTFAVKAADLAETEVRVTIRVRPQVSEPVWFADNLYGATAWARAGVLWRRVDTAEIRLMIALSLSAGEQAPVTLPLGAEYRRVRVLVRTPADGLGDWVDVRQRGGGG